MTNKELIICGINKINEAMIFFNDIDNPKVKLIMHELSKGLEVSANHLLKLMEEEGLE